MAKSEFVGVDGCPYGWFSVGFSPDGSYEVAVFLAFADLLTHYQSAKLILVDIPIGLPQGDERRQCDVDARRKLGSRRSSSVFPTPTRQTVQLVATGCDYAAASVNEFQITGRRITKQTFAICRKIAEVDQVLSNHDATTPVIREVHPELCFWALNGKNPMTHGKKTKAGKDKRLCVLMRREDRTQEIFDTAYEKYFRKDVARDDILDALAAAVTAYCGYNNLQSLPEGYPLDQPPLDNACLPMEMVYWIP